MIVLGISETHCATAAILRDGEIVGCASEERFTRLKNDAGYPRLAIDALLRELLLTPADIDVVALAGAKAYAREWMNRVLHDAGYARQYYDVRLDEPRRGLGRRARKLGARLGLARRSRGKFDVDDAERRAFVTDHLGGARERIVQFDHHACHAASAYFGSPFGGADTLVLTNDNSGDGLCATASSGRGLDLARHEAAPSAPGSLGSFYSFVTLLLGMKFGEHEYKVMGLAPYAQARAAERAEAALRDVFALTEGTPARFEWRRRGPRYRQLLEATLGQRFDAIAAGAQRIVEDHLTRWARLMRQRYGGERLALGGGVFMNVKANMLLAEEEWVRDLFVFPSCGDESNAIGAAYLGYRDACARAEVAPAPKPFGPAYLGPDLDLAEAEAVIRARDLAGRFRVTEHERIEERIADLLVADGVVARCAGRMEFGARALGNRSILANPSDHRVVTLINRMIKNRDFWMPFAPSVLREREADYVLNPKGLASPYMMLAFPTNPKRRDEIVAAVHPQDGTARAHLVDETWNPGYHRVIREFERRTGIGAVLNTSFNLHGEPLVCSPADAVDTFERSGLPHLALGRWLISKK
ncbi:MAG TPA: carbamoyltransferase C-terminal domain-containing protein [Methylomirabilota bacterium]|jgi:carbamoyltransferase|nr:carbamoyltransferase C-terminal domain-containing protein [Methylomirabilota bacterium]